MPPEIIYVNLAVSWGLMILIWMVQLIVYPGFSKVSDRQFEHYHGWYTIRISVIVVPLMLAEVAGGVFWMIHDTTVSSFVLVALPIAVVWLSTFILQVPIHRRLPGPSGRKWIKKLVATNWIRTAAWSMKALGLLVVVLS